MSDSDPELPTPPSRLVALLLALLAHPVIGFLYVGRLRRGLGWLAAGQAALLLAVMAVASERSLGLGIAAALGLVTMVVSLIDLLRGPPDSHRPGTGRIVLLAAGVGLLSYGERALLRGYVREAFKMPSGSMIPALQIQDHLFVNKLKRVPQRGEIIVFIYPIDPEKDFIKRVIGVPGDTVQLCGSQVSINGQRLRQEELEAPCEYEDFDDAAPPGKWSKVSCVAVREWNQDQSYVAIFNDPRSLTPLPCKEWTVPPNKVFTIGDNRDNSHDSRYWGFVPYENIKGKAWFIWWSSGAALRWNRIGQLIHQPFTSPAPGRP